MSPSFKRALFLLTIASTFLAGSSGGQCPREGLLFCACIMGILFAHEMGHYLMCRYYGVAATLPLFLPLPLSPFGTMGAVIRIKSPIPHRRALFDIGAAGPLAGMVVAIPIYIIGLRCCTVGTMANIPQDSVVFGDSLLTKWLSDWMFGPLPANAVLSGPPIVVAAWGGFFVTALNLLPVGQLDGGHVIYAVFGRNSRYFFAWMIGLVGALCVTRVLQINYVVFLAIILFIGFRHPPTIYDFVPLDWKRKLVAILVLAVFVLCFTPYPIYIPEG